MLNLQNIAPKHLLSVDGLTFVKTSVAAELMSIALNTLNRACREAGVVPGSVLYSKAEYVYQDESGRWWVHQNIDEVYYVKIAGKGGKLGMVAPVGCIYRLENS